MGGGGGFGEPQAGYGNSEECVLTSWRLRVELLLAFFCSCRFGRVWLGEEPPIHSVVQIWLCSTVMFNSRLWEVPSSEPLWLEMGWWTAEKIGLVLSKQTCGPGCVL